jgi:hypothetical protein
MQFNPTLYAQIAATSPVNAQQYLEACSAPLSANTAVNPAALPTPTSQPQAQPYVNPAAVAQPAPELARGTLEDFYSQPTGGSAPSITSKFFTKRQQGSWLQLEVTRDVTNADVRQQTTPQGQPQVYRDGKPKFVLVVPLKVTGSSDGTHFTEFPDGEGSLWVKGVLADELRRSMTAAGDPSGYPKGGATIVMQSSGEKPSRTPGFSPTKLYQLQYSGPVTAAAEAITTGVPPTVTAIPSAVTSAPAPTPVTLAAPSAAPANPPVPSIPTAAATTPPAAPVAVAADTAPVASFQPPNATPVAAPVLDDKAALLARLQGNG